MSLIPVIFSTAFLILFLTAVVAGLVIWFKIKKKAQEVSRSVFGNDDLISNLKKTEQEYMQTPKSISDGHSIYTPKLAKDFPEFNVDEMKGRAENCLKEYLRAIDE